MAISNDTAVFGSRYDEHAGGAFAGSAYVFVRDGMSWSQQAKLTANDAEPDDIFGHSVAISGDTVIVGAQYDDIAGNIDAGSAYVFVRNGTSWSQQAKLTAFDGEAFDVFGVSVSVHGDTAVVGAGRDDHDGGTDAGSAYVFVRDGTNWSFQTKLIADDTAPASGFGWHVNVFGNTAVLGAPRDDHAGGNDAGSAYVFVRNGSTWSQQAKLIAIDTAAGDEFGNSVFVSNDTAIVGSPRDDHAGGSNSGSAYVFERDGVNWSAQAKLVPSDAAPDDAFGHTVSGSGNWAIVGTPQDSQSGEASAGSATAFVRNGASWSEQTRLVASDAETGDNFGTAVAVSGVTALIGAPHDDFDNQPHAGAAYFFVLDADCNGNGIPDALDLELGTDDDCNQNLIPDTCDIAAGTSFDFDAEGTPDECQPFSSSAASISIALGGAIEFALDAGASRANELYIVLGSLSGTTPGISVDGQVLPLNLDSYLLLTLGGGGPLQDGIGLLDGDGLGAAALVLAPSAIPPGLAGLEVHHAFAAVSATASTVTFTSNSIPSLLAP